MRGKKTGGRKAGTPNKITADVRSLAQQYAPDAMAALVSIACDRKQQGVARVAACKEILDRGYGKVQEPIRSDPFANISMKHLSDQQLAEIAHGRTPALTQLQVTFIEAEEVNHESIPVTDAI